MDARKYFLLIVAGALVAGMLAILGLLAWQDARYSAATASDRLDGIRTAQRLVEQQKDSELATRAELIASNQAVVGYVVQALGDTLPGMEQDSASIVDLLLERRDQTGLAVIAVLDGQGQVVATTERFSTSADLSQAPLFVQAQQGKAISKGLWIDDKRLLHVAIVPLAAYGYSEAYLLAGMPVNQLLAQSIAEVGQADVAFLIDTADGALMTASTLDPALQDSLLPQLPKGATEHERIDFSADGRRYHASSTPLFGSTSGRLIALVSPRSDAPSSAALRLPLTVGGIVALVALGLLAWLLWTRVFAPAERLAAIIERTAEAEDFYVRAQESGAKPIARLAAAFNRLLPVVERRKRRRSAESESGQAERRAPIE